VTGITDGVERCSAFIGLIVSVGCGPIDEPTSTAEYFVANGSQVVVTLEARELHSSPDDSPVELATDRVEPGQEV